MTPTLAPQLHEHLILANSLACVQRNGMHPWGLHGIAHWWRVRHNGLLVAAHSPVAARSGADTLVVRLFALVHDAFREDDGSDPQHGARAAAWLTRVRSNTLHTDDAACEHTRAVITALDSTAFEQLRRACELHTSTKDTGDATIDACFVADRLDLARVGYRPDVRRMPAHTALLTPSFIDDAVRRTQLELSWMKNAEFAQTWRVTIPAVN